MTVPYISAPTWTARRRRGLPVRPASRAVPAASPDGSVGSLIRFGVRRIAWIDVAIQIIAGAAVIALGWAFVTGGALQRGTDAFTEWYRSIVVPVYATGISVVPADFRDGFFGTPQEIPPALVRPGPGYTMVAEISGLVEVASHS